MEIVVRGEGKLIRVNPGFVGIYSAGAGGAAWTRESKGGGGVHIANIEDAGIYGGVIWMCSAYIV